MTLKINAQTGCIKTIRRINDLSGENVKACMQCSTCSGMCPMTEEMDVSPRMVMHIAQLGMKDKLQSINTYWKCASCHACTVQCPRGIDIAKVMEALRQDYLRTKGNHIEPSLISKEVVKSVPQIALVAGFRKLTS
ncbi:MAG: 4Fe-4S dicluster domain-containing protein [Desulfotalea sp.]